MDEVDAGTRRGLAFGAVVALAALGGLSFAPWFRRDIIGTPPVHVWVNLWQASSLWQWSFVMTAAAVALGVVGARLVHRSGRSVYVLAVLGSGAGVAGVVLWLRQWWLIQHPDLGHQVYGMSVMAGAPSEEELYAIGKDTLPALAGDDGATNGYQTWCAYLGLALVVAVAVAVLGLAVRRINARGPRPAPAGS